MYIEQWPDISRPNELRRRMNLVPLPLRLGIIAARIAAQPAHPLRQAGLHPAQLITPLDLGRQRVDFLHPRPVLRLLHVVQIPALGLGLIHQRACLADQRRPPRPHLDFDFLLLDFGFFQPSSRSTSSLSRRTLPPDRSTPPPSHPSPSARAPPRSRLSPLPLPSCDRAPRPPQTIDKRRPRCSVCAIEPLRPTALQNSRRPYISPRGNKRFSPRTFPEKPTNPRGS